MLEADPNLQEEQGNSSAPSGFLGTLKNLAANTRLRVAVQVTVVIIVLAFVVRSLWLLWPEIEAYDWQVEPLYLLLGLAVLIARGPIICMAWRLILKRMGYPLSWRRAIRIYFYSGMAKYVPGIIWYAVGRALLAQQVGVPKMVTSVSIALETAMVTVAALTVGTLAFTVGAQADVLYLGIVLIALLIFLAWPDPWFALMNKGLKLIGRQPVTIKITGRDLLVLLPPFMLSWVAYGLISFSWTASLYPQLPWNELPAITGLFTLSWVIGFLAILIPNGWGIRETILTVFLTTLLGIPDPVAVGVAILSRLGSIIGEATWAFIAWQIKPDAPSSIQPDPPAPTMTSEGIEQVGVASK